MKIINKNIKLQSVDLLSNETNNENWRIDKLDVFKHRFHTKSHNLIRR